MFLTRYVSCGSQALLDVRLNHLTRYSHAPKTTIHSLAFVLPDSQPPLLRNSIVLCSYFKFKKKLENYNFNSLWRHLINATLLGQ